MPEYRVEKEYEYPMGYARRTVWILYEDDTELWFFKTKKFANLAKIMIEDGKIANTGDIESRVIRWHLDNALEIPKGHY